MTDISTEKLIETAILVGIITQEQNEEQSQEYLDELLFLAETAGLQVQRTFTQRLINAHPKTFIGTGKVEEIASYILENAIDVAVFDDELSPSQL
ncbi:MAG TPA: GTPase HflX, partial [Bacteroidales bacterium]|nr:GTPase HflX [Bacteroidales bacterium]